MATRKTAAKGGKRGAAAKQRKAAPAKKTARASRKSTPNKPAGESYVPYSVEAAAAVCALIAAGNSVRAIHAMEGMPSKAAIFQWLAKHEEFRVAYMAATKERAHARFESADEVIHKLETGEIDSRSARVMIDAIKWQCAIEDASRYGTLSRHEVTGKNGGPLQSQNLPPKEMTPEERIAEIRSIAQQHPELFAVLAGGAAQ